MGNKPTHKVLFVLEIEKTGELNDAKPFGGKLVSHVQNKSAGVAGEVSFLNDLFAIAG